jgi:hypothetical protein
VTALTKSPRPVHLKDVAELEYELEQSLVYHIPSNTMRKKMGTFLSWAMLAWVIIIMMRTLRFQSWRDSEAQNHKRMEAISQLFFLFHLFLI